MDRLSTRSPWSAAILVVAVICLGGCETSNDATLLATQLSTTSADTLSQVADAFGKLSGSTAASAVDEKTLERRNCGHIDSTPDGVAYVPYTDEVWVTSPRDNTVWILNAKTLKQKAKLSFPGRPEGYAVDTRRGRFYMNYEDKDLTTAINLKTHKTVAEWRPDCGPDGPHGLQIDQNSGYLFVACSLGAKVLNAGGNGQVLSLITTGDGVDDINLSPATHMLYIGSPKDGNLTVARVDSAGKLTVVAVVPTHVGERNGVVTKNGTVYMAHARPGNFTAIVVAPNPK